LYSSQRVALFDTSVNNIVGIMIKIRSSFYYLFNQYYNIPSVDLFMGILNNGPAIPGFGFQFLQLDQSLFFINPISLQKIAKALDAAVEINFCPKAQNF